MINSLLQFAATLADQAKNVLSKTAIAVGAPSAGGIVGIISFFEKITPVLTVISLVTGLVLGILSYRLKLKESKRREQKK